MDIEAYLEAGRELVEEYLISYLERRRAEIPETLYDGIIYALEGGKRLRPILVMASAEANGEEAELVLPTAAGIELLHTYSLIHDDLPALDDDDWRRGKPSCHRVFGEGIALLIGDALIPLGFELILLEQSQLSPKERVLEVLGRVARAIGPRGMVGGQVLDLEEGSNGLPLEETYEKKTGALFSAAAAAGGILAGAAPERVEALEEFGVKLGLAYQILDDLMDLEEEADSYPHLVGVEQARAAAKQFVQEALQPLELLGEEGALLRGLAEYIMAKKGENERDDER